MAAQPTTKRDFLTQSELLAALEAGERLEASPNSDYPGEAVEYAPRKDTVNNHPDFYPWHVTGRPDYARLPRMKVVAVAPAATAPTAHETAARRAVAVFSAAFKAAFDDDIEMAVSVIRDNGERVSITGRLNDIRMGFDPADVEALLNFLARLIESGDPGVIAARCTYRDDDGYGDIYAWNLADGSWNGDADVDRIVEDDYSPSRSVRFDKVDAPERLFVTGEVQAVLARHA